MNRRARAAARHQRLDVGRQRKVGLFGESFSALEIARPMIQEGERSMMSEQVALSALGLARRRSLPFVYGEFADRCRLLDHSAVGRPGVGGEGGGGGGGAASRQIEHGGGGGGGGGPFSGSGGGGGAVVGSMREWDRGEEEEETEGRLAGRRPLYVGREYSAADEAARSLATSGLTNLEAARDRREIAEMGAEI